jgi:hypothetical protein
MKRSGIILVAPNQPAEKPRTIHEITRSGTKGDLSSSDFVFFRGSSCSSKNGNPFSGPAGIISF